MLERVQITEDWPSKKMSKIVCVYIEHSIGNKLNKSLVMFFVCESRVSAKLHTSTRGVSNPENQEPWSVNHGYFSRSKKKA